jgi:hypothetical protein
MRFLSQRTAVIAAATAVAGGMVLTALAVSASASSDDVNRTTGTSVIVGSQPSGTPAPSASNNHEANEYKNSHDSEHGEDSDSHEANEHRNGHDSDDDGEHGEDSDG